jgi:NAD(P)H-dependent flavin oxidoreductase YrpB (nitropropane dioxygenase family)
MALTTRFTRLVGCSVPLQQAGMGGVATPDLAAAVAEAGGLGMIGAVRMTAPALREALDQIARRTRGTFGVNFLMPFLDRACVEVASRKARVVEFFYGDPDSSLVEVVHAGGALACWQVGSVEEARAAAAAGCDFIVVQGVEAGGHVRGRIGLLALLPEVIEAVSVPVVAAGGIGTAQAMAAALAAGADGVRMGTRFVAAQESAAHPLYKDALIRAAAGDTVLTEAFSATWPNAPHRVLRSCVEAARAFEGEIVGELDLGGQKLPLLRFASPCPTRTTTGTIEAMALYAGETVGVVREVQPAAVIVRELADGAQDLLRRWTAG